MNGTRGATPGMRPDLIEQHIAAMTTASTNLLRQMRDEGLRYRVSVRPEDTATMHVHVHQLTPEIAERIHRCLSGTGMRVAVKEE
jgi:archaeosine-15-forming tRNA-guanine transglycosylase